MHFFSLLSAVCWRRHNLSPFSSVVLLLVERLYPRLWDLLFHQSTSLAVFLDFFLLSFFPASRTCDTCVAWSIASDMHFLVSSNRRQQSHPQICWVSDFVESSRVSSRVSSYSNFYSTKFFWQNLPTDLQYRISWYIINLMKCRPNPDPHPNHRVPCLGLRALTLTLSHFIE